MEIDRQECPGCGSEQAFRPQWRYHPEENGVPAPNDRYITIFIACSVCPWERDIEVSTVEIERQRKRLGRHIALAQRQRQSFGAVQPHTQTAIDTLRREISRMRNHYINGKSWT